MIVVDLTGALRGRTHLLEIGPELRAGNFREGAVFRLVRLARYSRTVVGLLDGIRQLQYSISLLKREGCFASSDLTRE